MVAVDAKHVARLREIVKHGWPGTALVAAGEHDLDPSLYATSVDRVRIQDGLKQLYGSQFDTKGDKCEPQPIEHPEHVEERRKAMGLDTLDEYAKELCVMYKK